MVRSTRKTRRMVFLFGSQALRVYKPNCVGGPRSVYGVALWWLVVAQQEHTRFNGNNPKHIGSTYNVCSSLSTRRATNDPLVVDDVCDTWQTDTLPPDSFLFARWFSVQSPAR